MCAIVDANVVGEMFGHDKSEAGRKFFEWLDSGKGILVAGGKVSEELGQSEQFREWARSALLAGQGQLRIMDKEAVVRRTEEIKKEGTCRSDGPHVLALAQISGARLLYSNDRDLHQDFRDKALVDNPRGKIYSTLNSGALTKSHRELLAKKDLCRSK